MQLHDSLHDTFTLPPKRFLVTTFIPSAWVDDALVAERKTGLASWLRDLLSSDDFKDNSALLAFLTPDASATPRHFGLEDVLPSTLSRKAGMKFAPEDEVDAMATPIAAAYYPDWSAGSNPPEKIDFSKFDILFFGASRPELGVSRSA